MLAQGLYAPDEVKPVHNDNPMGPLQQEVCVVVSPGPGILISTLTLINGTVVVEARVDQTAPQTRICYTVTSLTTGALNNMNVAICPGDCPLPIPVPTLEPGGNPACTTTVLLLGNVDMITDCGITLGFAGGLPPGECAEFCLRYDQEYVIRDDAPFQTFPSAGERCQTLSTTCQPAPTRGIPLV